MKTAGGSLTCFSAIGIALLTATGVASAQSATAPSAMAFDPVLHEGFERVQPLEKDRQLAHDAMLAADHLVIIFPLWLGTLPAILKGFLERVFQPELVAAARQDAFTRPAPMKRRMFRFNIFTAWEPNHQR
jgi:putative NADPH-quinone reductase